MLERMKVIVRSISEAASMWFLPISSIRASIISVRFERSLSTIFSIEAMREERDICGQVPMPLSQASTVDCKRVDTSSGVICGILPIGKGVKSVHVSSEDASDDVQEQQEVTVLGFEVPREG